MANLEPECTEDLIPVPRTFLESVASRMPLSISRNAEDILRENPPKPVAPEQWSLVRELSINSGSVRLLARGAAPGSMCLEAGACRFLTRVELREFYSALGEHVDYLNALEKWEAKQ